MCTHVGDVDLASSIALHLASDTIPHIRIRIRSEALPEGLLGVPRQGEV